MNDFPAMHVGISRGKNQPRDFFGWQKYWISDECKEEKKDKIYFYKKKKKSQ